MEQDTLFVLSCAFQSEKNHFLQLFPRISDKLYCWFQTSKALYVRAIWHCRTRINRGIIRVPTLITHLWTLVCDIFILILVLSVHFIWPHSLQISLCKCLQIADLIWISTIVWRGTMAGSPRQCESFASSTWLPSCGLLQVSVMSADYTVWHIFIYYWRALAYK